MPNIAAHKTKLLFPALGIKREWGRARAIIANEFVGGRQSAPRLQTAS